jgi:perosamine synthetase
MTWKIPLFKTYWDEEDIKSVADVIKRGSYWATGPEIEEFEDKLSEYIGTKYAVTFNSGSSALHALLLAYDLKQGDEIIVPSFTFIATANAPLFVGAKPVFAEIEDRTYGLDPEDVKEKITNKTKAIMPIHYGGCSCLIRELKEIAEDHNLLLIEDAAESLGAKIKDKKVGTFGDSAMLSFCQNKVISTGEGGAIVTNSKEICEKLKLIRSHGRLETQDYFSSTGYMDYITLGYNFRMPTMVAALGLSQLNKIDKVIKMRRDKAGYMTEKLSKNKEITLPIPPPDYFHVYQMYAMRINNNLRDGLMKYLSEKGIMTKVYFPPIHLTHFYRNEFGYKGGELPITEEISDQVLSLPLYPTLTEKKIDYIIEKINNFLEGER